MGHRLEQYGSEPLDGATLDGAKHKQDGFVAVRIGRFDKICWTRWRVSRSLEAASFKSTSGGGRQAEQLGGGVLVRSIAVTAEARLPAYAAAETLGSHQKRLEVVFDALASWLDPQLP